ncbi:hypothetical protein tooticki91_gp002 [Flavobacterium phage vB_FspS_tooticki9-1]|uniref:Lipoprotein n=31 Tax=Caudoviricetes TaxID=2731619 RepID=A0A6B9LRX2_9CAUD|nr:hypothetical protein HWC87_gp02 [Flavobacterium phage vB_FspS_filifjonk9-1]YP_009854654.1 hypothetical protein HWC88_gp02 [Flavobacterium phage vB_FspS_hattifnatt9-1]YP_009854731.1 hypothetical protein HWC89_gp03 [Flavobacterium phage vB_FspS_hemulen6-1]YP_009854858.1 hypothetical protein HWC91_gp03 [Flavobacterium phage vB_FspS_lillamy9-1]YP_009854931.1 hypothetical protein HWC92_gp03 [Flavobacterium phage vB_FspS_morran9-1]YP_009855003.1 hypothetical protein HWC93_gp02 [Flavobacterium pha
MKKTIIIILIAFLLIGCGSVKKTSEETQVKTETQTDITKFSNSFTLEPVNLDKPILLGKDTIYNTRVIYNNSKEIIKEKQNVDFKEEKQSKEVDYSKTINIVANKLILMFTCFFVLYLIYSFIKNKTTL